MIIFAIVLGVAGWFVLALISTNLIGMFVRGFFTEDTEELRKELHPSMHEELHKLKRADFGATVLSFILIAIFLYLLFKYVNTWALFAALLLMVGRIPDLIWEIKHGRKVTKTDRPKGILYTITGVMDWLAFPVIVWAIYNLLK